MTGLELVVVLVASLVAFAVSASAGLGGSLVLVPALVFVLGAKEGIALAALLLAANNVAKVVAYRRTLPWRGAAPLIAATVVGAWAGAALMTAAPESWVTAAVVVSIVATLVHELRTGSSRRPVGSPALAVGSGLTSGFSGTSGPLKGVAVRALGVDRRHTVGAATLLSLAGDVTKAATFASAGLLAGTELLVAVTVAPLMVAGTAIGYDVNNRLGARGFATWFWLVMGGYLLRLAGLWG